MTETRVQPPKSRIQPPAAGKAGASDRAGYVTVIRPASRLPRLDLRELWRFRELLVVLVWRDVVVRYKQTVLGAGWAIFQPVLTAVVYTLIFGRFAKFSSGHLPYPLFTFAGALAMQYFSASLTHSSTSLVSNVPLVTKVYFPRLLLPLGSVVVPLVDFALGLPVMIALMAWYNLWPGSEVVYAAFFILLALVTALGSGLTLSALNVRYRDIPYVIPVFLQVLPLLSGVPFALDALPPKWQWLLSLNPMTTVVAGWRWAVLSGPPLILGQAAVSAGVALILLVAGLAYFRRSEPRFADTI